ncbi:MAG: DUF2849 domain-containing protein [Pseudomonadota bacterium]
MAKAREGVAQIVSANDLMTGAVVYATAHGWSHAISDAAVAHDAATADALLWRATADEATVVGPYLLEVTVSAEPSRAITPAHVRERLRLTGPSFDAAWQHPVTKAAA